MDPKEYQNLADIEERHWFYAGKRQIVKHWLDQTKKPLATDLLVDCGAGTGKFASEMISRCQVFAIDDHEESLELARRNLGPDRVKKGTCVNLPLPSNSVDLLTALDVIEHIDDDRGAMREFARVVRPGGVVVITVPALMALWSDWDVVLHHHRRYTRKSLKAIISTSDFEMVHLNYINVAVLPIVFAVRKFRGLKEKIGIRATNRSEDKIPPPFLNSVLQKIFVSLACQKTFSFPAGVGLLAVLRRK